MEYEFVTYETRDNICWITLNRPEKLNALSVGLQRDLWAALEEADLDWDIRCIVIKAAGRAFCAGYDLTPSPERNENVERRHNLQFDINGMHKTGKKWNDLWNISKPVICQVHGYCLAAGTDIAVHSDIVIVAEDAQIGFPPVRNLGTPATHMWTYLIGPQWTKWAFFTGDNFSGKKAAEIGWALEAVPADQLEDTVNELAGRIARVSYEMLAAQQVHLQQGHRADGPFPSPDPGCGDGCRFSPVHGGQGVPAHIKGAGAARRPGVDERPVPGLRQGREGKGKSKGIGR